MWTEIAIAVYLAIAGIALTVSVVNAASLIRLNRTLARRNDELQRNSAEQHEANHLIRALTALVCHVLEPEYDPSDAASRERTIHLVRNVRNAEAKLCEFRSGRR